MTSPKLLKSESPDVKLPSEKSFGLTFVVIIFVISILPLFKKEPPSLLLLCLSLTLLIISFLMPKILIWPNRVWFKFGLLLHKITSPIFIFILFFVVFTPLAIVLRLCKKDILKIQMDTKLSTYWINSKNNNSSMLDQF